MNKQWLILFFAAFLEVLWVIGLAHAYNFWTWTVTLIFILWSNYLMISVAQKLPTGTVYTVFVGLGAGGTVLAEILFFGEAFQIGKMLLIGLLLIGVVGLTLVTEEKSPKSVVAEGRNT